MRMGLAHEPGLAQEVCAGPWHPQIGNMARALALYYYLEKAVAAWRQKSGGRKGAPLGLCAPRRCQGMFWGGNGALKPRYAALGLEPRDVSWWEREEMALFSKEPVEERSRLRTAKSRRSPAP
jgi:hypothetical protein